MRTWLRFTIRHKRGDTQEALHRVENGNGVPKVKPALNGLLGSLGQPFDDLPGQVYPRSSLWNGIRLLKHTCDTCHHKYLEMVGVGIHSNEECDQCLNRKGRRNGG